MKDREVARIKETEFEAVQDGFRLRGEWCVDAEIGRAPMIVVLHGIPRAKPQPGDSSYREIALQLAQRGFLAVIFNFRGAGLSEGDISMAGWVRDLQAIIVFARALPEADASRVALLGFSAGGAVAIYAAAHDPTINAVVSASSPARFSLLQQSMPSARWVKLFKEIGLIRSRDFPPDLAAWEAEFQEIEPVRWVEKLAPRPFLIMHGANDELIPAAQARELYEKASEGKELIIVPDGKHRLRMDPAALTAAEEWLARWAKQEN